ncbi:MAG: EAL domain-containing protein [Desulfobacteraceae bacterium]|nr:EAL domain-containing protein [Desulfobacteraceae bacterium]
MDKNIKILFLDESKASRDRFDTVLKEEDYTNYLCLSSSKKLFKFLTNETDIILFDIELIKSHGLKLISDIKNNKEFHEIPIVMLIGTDDEADLKKALDAGAIDYISKPINKTTFRARIETVLKLKEEIAKQKKLARFDPLTKLPNRLYFNEQLELAMKRAQRNQLKIAVLVTDLDHFKMVNDTFGHFTGDKLLIELAKRMKECIRGTDTIARISGDEFFFILENITKKSTVTEIIHRLLNSVKAPFLLDGNEAYVGISVGVSLSTKNITSEILVRNADLAMYDVKAHGRNNYKFFTDKMDIIISKKAKLCKLLFDAFERDEFYLNYQPRIDIKTNQITGVEALLRWNHPDNKVIPSAEIIPLLEEIGLINQVGDWALKTACEQNLLWQKNGCSKVPVSVNLSPIQFHDEKLPNIIKQILKDTKLNPCFLEIEINEGVFIVDDYIVENTLTRLKKLKINMITMDDFGSGYSSLGYLKKFPIDSIKIDKEFVQNFTNNSSNAALVSAIAAMGIALELKSIVAVGVESESQIPFLRHMGCDSYQGYLMSPPVSANKIKKMLKNQALNIINLTNKKNEKNISNSNIRILFVDDFPTNIQIALKLLQSSGYKIDTAKDGEEAVKLFQENGPYNLVFMDLQMPIYDGYEATKKIRAFENGSRVPIIAMTAYDMEGVRDRCLAAGMDDFIAKPFKLKDFNEIIEKWKKKFS